MQKMHFRPGLRRGPHWGSSRRSPDPLVGWGGTSLPLLHPFGAGALIPAPPELGSPLHIISGYTTVATPQ